MALLFSFLTLIMLSSPSHQTEEPRLVDHIIRDSAFNSFPKHQRTSHLYNVQLPSNLSGITAQVARFRAGSLRRHGATVNEFTFAPGVVIHPHMKRLIAVQQNLGNHSDIYNSSYYNITGYQLVTPVLGLLIYDAANLSELDIFVKKKPITVDFSEIVRVPDARGAQAMCATFQLDGNVSLSNLTDSKLSVTWRQGHFAVVVELPLRVMNEERAISKWKVIVVSVIGGAFGAMLLGLVLVAMVNVKRHRSQLAELERRAYEEEALQISMVGHVRAPTAAGARTTPALENYYSALFC